MCRSVLHPLKGVGPPISRMPLSVTPASHCRFADALVRPGVSGGLVDGQDVSAIVPLNYLTAHDRAPTDNHHMLRCVPLYTDHNGSTVRFADRGYFWSIPVLHLPRRAGPLDAVAQLTLRTLLFPLFHCLVVFRQTVASILAALLHDVVVPRPTAHSTRVDGLFFAPSLQRY